MSVRALYASAEAQILREVARRADGRPIGTSASPAELAAIRRYASRVFARQRAAVYREVRRAVPGARQAGLLERLTAAEATARASAADLLRTGAGDGARLIGLVDSAGRRRSIADYAEVALSATADRVRLDRQLRDLRRNGVERLTVHAEPGECPKCRPWDGRTLTLAGLDAAIRAGLRHPRCRCTIVRARPGVP